MNYDDKNGAPNAELPQSQASPSFELQRPRTISEYVNQTPGDPHESEPNGEL
jgi:hypothetical protein